MRAVPGRLARDFEEAFGSGRLLLPGPGSTEAGLLESLVPEPSLKSVFVWVCGTPILALASSDVPALGHLIGHAPLQPRPGPARLAQKQVM